MIKITEFYIQTNNSVLSLNNLQKEKMYDSQSSNVAKSSVKNNQKTILTVIIFPFPPMLIPEFRSPDAIATECCDETKTFQTKNNLNMQW